MNNNTGTFIENTKKLFKIEDTSKRLLQKR